MRVFVTGANGYIGAALCRGLQRAGHEVRGLLRSEVKGRELSLSPAFRAVLGDLKEPASYLEAAAGCDAVVHAGLESGPQAGSVDLTATEALLGICGGAGPRVFVFTSGVWVLGSTGDTPADESSPTDRAAALVAWRPAREQQVLSASREGLATAVVRPGIVFGGRGGLMPGFFESAAAGGAAKVVGDGLNRWPTIHRKDLAEVYLRLLELAESDGFRALAPADRVFHAVDGTSERVADMAAAASRAAGEEGRIQLWPLEDARQTYGPFADALALDQVVAGPRTAQVLGWRPRYRGFVRNAVEAFNEWASPI